MKCRGCRRLLNLDDANVDIEAEAESEAIYIRCLRCNEVTTLSPRAYAKERLRMMIGRGKHGKVREGPSAGKPGG